MITLTKVSYIHEADMICMKLETAGIQSFIADEALSSVYPLYSGALGGIRIQINEDDLEHAREILGDTTAVDTGMFKCPKCSSDSIEYENVSKRSAFLSLFLVSMPITWNKRKCTCNECGHTWKDKRSDPKLEGQRPR
jgi:hypothetical protein